VKFAPNLGKNVPAAVAMFDREMRYLEVSDRWCTTYSVDSSRILGRSHYDAFPDLPERYKEIHRRGLAGETIRADEDRWDREGSTTWSRWEVRPWQTAEGAVGGILIFAEDITRRKQMEEALSDMSRKLIESQEQERARIGRELHDDINQRLAMLSLELEQLQDNPSEIQPRVKELRRQMAEVSNDVQALSHDLHSSKLEYLGVVAGMKSWCKESAERQKIELDCKTAVSSPLPPEIGLSLLPRIRKMSGYREPIDCRVFVNAGSKYSVKKSDWSQFPPHRDNPNFGRMSPPSNTESGHSRMMEEMSFSYRSLCPCKSVAKKQVDMF